VRVTRKTTGRNWWDWGIGFRFEWKEDGGKEIKMRGKSFGRISRQECRIDFQVLLRNSDNKRRRVLW
jgi:hypothetical protein